jgi:Niemann-Pick C1 protein
MTEIHSSPDPTPQPEQPNKGIVATTTSLANPTLPDYAWSVRWTAMVNRLRAPIVAGIQVMTSVSARNPKRTIGVVVATSVFLFVVGLFTNFSVNVDENVLWTPKNSPPIRESRWIKDESGFPRPGRNFVLVFHNTGGSTDGLLTRPNVAKIFTALDLVRNLPKYAATCALWEEAESRDCDIYGVTKFWNHSIDVFVSTVATDQEAVEQMSSRTFPDDGTPVSEHNVWGNPLRDTTTGRLTSAQTYIVTIKLPSLDDKDNTTVADFERQAIDVILDLQEQWAEDPTSLQVEVYAKRSFADEIQRAIVKDIPFVPIVFVIMGLFTSIIFFKRDRIQSRSLFGFTAVISIVLSIMAGYGLMFICGVPFTSMTQLLPFIFFGVGLDDAFIITGAYFRLDRAIDPLDRVCITMDEIGMGIFLTTLTSAAAMASGCSSSTPAVYWLCLYAVPTTILILLFQLTFFIACLILDERRMAAQHRDCFRCLSRKSAAATDTKSSGQEDNIVHTVDRWMGWYAEKLLLPWVKILVLLSFLAVTVACSISTSHLRQSFSFTDVLPTDSYISAFFHALTDYSVRAGINPAAYFRDVDQSDPSIQDQMETFVNELVTIDAIEHQPPFFWLRDFRSFVGNHSGTLATLEFPAQMDAFLDDPVYVELYHDHIVRDEQTGMITTSRVVMNMDNIDEEDVKKLIKALNDQRAICDTQSVNAGLSDYRFFTYHANYNSWQFYAQVGQEVVSNTVSSIAAMTGIALLLMPHWSATLFVFTLIVTLYVDLMGVMQWAGVSINPVSYIALVMSIGLLVDFVIHVLLRFYEAPGNRHEKTIVLLKTMGSSILIGAVTTFLGTMSLAFSTSDIFYTIFIAFLALVVLGSTYGLILLPVILSMIGPEVEIPVVSKTREKMRSIGASPDKELDDLEPFQVTRSSLE